MMTPSDGGLDGGKLGYLRQPERHRQIDPELFDILEHATSAPSPPIADDRKKPRYHSRGDLLQRPASDDLSGRHVFMGRCLDTFHNGDLIFFDPKRTPLNTSTSTRCLTFMPPASRC
ncbi:hypothetical protein JVX98_23330 [Ensifer sp. PDNC004]|uniref:hypothetical protein n=1 Tax=Ensifer sp. PDNC004 TaxID=2811423 RepID=UPI00196323E0|nr:hypothetical protein [Ensifer sp. PDNC004]QRY67280.1 hypothetical protein JVX98_23330 [Ensifer sp. PDNC004]